MDGFRRVLFPVRTIPNHINSYGCKTKMAAKFESLTPGFNTITPVTWNSTLYSGDHNR